MGWLPFSIAILLALVGVATVAQGSWGILFGVIELGLAALTYRWARRRLFRQVAP